MPKKIAPRTSLGKHHLRAWREYRGLTQEDAAERIGRAHTTIGRIENGGLGYTQETLEALARAYGCQPWELLAFDPRRQTEPFVLMHELGRLQAPERETVARMIRGLSAGSDHAA